MRESEQFDDLTVADEHMPPPEMATMSLEDYHAGSAPDFSPIHENEDDDFDVGGFDIPMDSMEVHLGKTPVTINRTPIHLEGDEREFYQTEGDQEDNPGFPGGVVLAKGSFTENTFSFFGTESYSLPKN